VEPLSGGTVFEGSSLLLGVDRAVFLVAFLLLELELKTGKFFWYNKSNEIASDIPQ
jgi:hypothetical protein